MSKTNSISIFWFRRDLRLEDNVGLTEALSGEWPVMPMFIFDTNITDELPADDARLNFIYDSLESLQEKLSDKKSGLCIRQGDPLKVYQELAKEFDLKAVYTNRDYEPYALERDKQVAEWAKKNNIEFHDFKDQVIFEPGEVLKDDGDPYVVYTPYKNKWLETYQKEGPFKPVESDLTNFASLDLKLPSKSDLGIKKSTIDVPEIDFSVLSDYKDTRDYPAQDGTSRIGPHLRFGTIGIRTVVQKAKKHEETYLSELIWREFFMQILYHFPEVVNHNFRRKYDAVKWRNNKDDFKRWCEGNTGYPIVDAGMRELNQTGYMHNRVRMITAGFLCKHLLIDWQWGEAYFAKKLLDYELASNNGNWQWAAGTGCDAAPYFRVFNPATQIKKFDKDLKYIKKWVPEYDQMDYPEPMVEHKAARERALETYKKALN